jgi:hypothetical protein
VKFVEKNVDTAKIIFIWSIPFKQSYEEQHNLEERL